MDLVLQILDILLGNHVNLTGKCYPLRVFFLFVYIFLLLNLTVVVNVAVENIMPNRNNALVNVYMTFWCYHGG